MLDVTIVGGGLAGLAAGTLLAQQGYAIRLFERLKFPFHRVCGEYVSNEARPFLGRLGIQVEALGAHELNRLRITARGGSSCELALASGGFGLSRYCLDYALLERAIASGVQVCDGQEVLDVSREGDAFVIDTTLGRFSSRVVLGCHGKRAKLDKKLRRSSSTRRSDYVAVKRHYRGECAQGLVTLHAGAGGYCGVSRVEDGLVNVCYLTTREELRRAGTFDAFEAHVLTQNPHLRGDLGRLKAISKPLAISQLDFGDKPAVEASILMLGDSAGLIHPLCGNGMAMALHAAKFGAQLVNAFLKGSIDRQALELSYRAQWQSNFRLRRRLGRMLQPVFERQKLCELAVSGARLFSSTAGGLVRLSHGSAF